VPVLLLAQGDPQAKDLLRRAIEARYAMSPPAIENLRLDMNGRVRTKIGPIMTWVPLHIRASFNFPSAVRWDFTVRPVGVPVQRGCEAFDGSVYRQSRGRRSEIIDNPDIIYSLRHRVWAMAAVLLTPLGEHFVKLETAGTGELDATNVKLGGTVRLKLRGDYTLEQVQVNCLNPESGRTQLFTMALSAEQQPVDGIMMPRRIQAFWDDQPYYEVEPTHIENRTEIASEVFSLEADMETE